ncbi:MAG: ABC transporter ATP-binding protein, partial [Oscillospiraceae bacterium]|nr:ABC transporter ATP-binding protein [Oscillospiraceae bacterium]
MKAKKQKKQRTLLKNSLRGNVRYLVLSAFSLIFSTVSYLTPIIVGFLVDFVLQGKSDSLLGPVRGIADRYGRDFFLQRLWILALALLSVTLLSVVFNHLRGRFTAMASEGLAKKMRDAVYAHIQDAPYDYHKHVSTGDLVQRCSSDINMIRRFVGVQMLEMIRAAIMVSFALAILMPINRKLALLSTVMFPVIIFFSVFFFKRVRALFTETDEAEAALSTMMQENYAGVRVVRAFGQQKHELDRFRVLNEDYRVKNFRLSKLFG